MVDFIKAQNPAAKKAIKEALNKFMWPDELPAKYKPKWWGRNGLKRMQFSDVVVQWIDSTIAK